jgi:probable rRNA maturation factor
MNDHPTSPRAPSEAAAPGSARDGHSADAEPPQPCTSIDIDVVEEDGDWSTLPDAVSLIEAAAAALVRHGRLRKHGPLAAAIALSSDAHVASLNATFRGKDKPTNVLSFPANAASVTISPSAAGEPIFIGDVILALETITTEAAELAIPLSHHLQHLTIHGLLHLMGYDHETEPDAVEMETLETAILVSIAIPDPYAELT